MKKAFTNLKRFCYEILLALQWKLYERLRSPKRFKTSNKKTSLEDLPRFEDIVKPEKDQNNNY